MRAKQVHFVPKGYHVVTPYLSIKGAAGAIAFYTKIFGAKEVMRMPGPDGTIGDAEIQIDDSRIMLADEYPDMNFRGPRAFGGTPVHIHVYVKDADKVAKKAMAAGATLLRPVAGSVLWRPERLSGRPLWTCLTCGYPYKGSFNERDEETCCCGGFDC